MRVLPYGPRAVLAEYDTLEEVMGVAARLRTLDLPGVVDVVPAARTVLVTHAGVDASLAERLRTELSVVVEWAPPTGTPIEVEVRYDGIDLVDVAALTGMTTEEVISVHSGVTYVAAFCGFMPGFTYLTGLDPRLQLPRRDRPRARVPAGSVAIASDMTGVYPAASPGGWHLLGTTDAVLWDEGRSQPALIPPGSTVRFVPR